MTNQEKEYDAMFSTLLHGWANEDIEIWIVLETVAKALRIDYRKGLTVAQGESLWNGVEGLVARMLHYGYVAFSFMQGGGRAAWPEQEPKQVLARVKNKWIEYKGEFPNVGFIVWFHNAKDNKDYPMK